MTTVQDEPEQPPRFGRLRSMVSRVPTSWFGWVVAAIVLAVTAGFGGLGTVNADDVTTYSAGQTYRGTPLTITVTAAAKAPQKDPALLGQQGKTALLVSTEITNTWNRPLHPSDSVLDSALPGILWQGRKADEVRHTTDGTIAPDLEPGVRTPLTWIWYVDTQQAGALADGSTVALDLQDQTVREVGLVDKQVSVADPVLSAHVRLTVTG